MSPEELLALLALQRQPQQVPAGDAAAPANEEAKSSARDAQNSRVLAGRSAANVAAVNAMLQHHRQPIVHSDRTGLENAAVVLKNQSLIAAVPPPQPNPLYGALNINPLLLLNVNPLYAALFQQQQMQSLAGATDLSRIQQAYSCLTPQQQVASAKAASGQIWELLRTQPHSTAARASTAAAESKTHDIIRYVTAQQQPPSLQSFNLSASKMSTAHQIPTHGLWQAALQMPLRQEVGGDPTRVTAAGPGGIIVPSQLSTELSSIIHFPSVLHRLITEAELAGCSHIVHFTQTGLAFSITDVAAFEQRLLPIFMPGYDMPRVRLQLTKFGFTSPIKKAADATMAGDGGGHGETYMHNLFVKSNAQLALQIVERDPSVHRVAGQQGIAYQDLAHHAHEPFPEKLFRVIAESEQAGLGSIVSFTPSGAAFKLHKPEEFFKRIAPKYFRHTKPDSFRRQCNLYGFTRVFRGPDKGAYAHDYFQRGRPDLLYKIRSLQRNVGPGERRKIAPPST